MRFVRSWFSAFILLGSSAAFGADRIEVRNFGAVGDGQTLDTDAVNRAIEAASQTGGGTIHFSAGTYLCFSIRLKSNITLELDAGCTLLAADPTAAKGAYDEAEPNPSETFQDFGHSHWHNSLISGDSLENIAITGWGRIDGKGLTRRGPPPRGPRQESDRPPGLIGVSFGMLSATSTRSATTSGTTTTSGAGSPPGNSAPGPAGQRTFNMAGQGNKAIGLRLCRNVLIRDVSLLNCGHFAILATGVDNLTLDNLRVDTNRDGFDIDGCRNVHVLNCSVNTPNDDAIVLKSTFALNFIRDCENITISNCHLSGYNAGSLLDGTFLRTQELAPDRDGVTGRIKIGTETDGSFRNITISNCTFDRCRGLALETVDGGVIEDVAISNITMRDVVSSPIFIRLGNRARGPAGTKVGAIRRILISNIVAANVDPRYACIISGIPDHRVEDVRVSNLAITYRGGGTKEDALLQPAEKETSYPDPSMFGKTPAYGFYIRHAQGIAFDHVRFAFESADFRPVIALDEVSDVEFDHVSGMRAEGGPFFLLKNVHEFSAQGTPGVSDVRGDSVVEGSL